MHLHALSKVPVQPLARLGFVHKFWTINLDILLSTWASMAIMALFVLYIRRNIKRPENCMVFLVKEIVKFFQGSVQEAFGYDNPDCTSIVTGLFFFTLFCNICGILPFIREATLDLNTTMAIATICFLYVQYQALLVKRCQYFSKFFKPIFIFLPINIIGQLSKIASLSFRLFGNIVGGAIIWDLLYQSTLVQLKTPFTLGCLIFIPLNLIIDRVVAQGNFERGKKIIKAISTTLQIIPGTLLFFGFFEGLMHAFVIALLTSMYISGEVSDSGH